MKKDTENKGSGIVEYCIFLKGCVNIPFDSRQYTREGAIQRCLNLSKDFSGLTLKAKRDGVEYQLYPTRNDEKRIIKERLRNARSYDYYF